MEDEYCFLGVLSCDCRDALNGHVVPRDSCLHGKWIVNVGAGQFGILVNLVLCCLIGCWPAARGLAAVLQMWDSAYVSGTVTSQAMGFPLAHGNRVWAFVVIPHQAHWLFNCSKKNKAKLECGPMPNVMVALPNTGGALCSTPQSLADAHY